MIFFSWMVQRCSRPGKLSKREKRIILRSASNPICPWHKFDLNTSFNFPSRRSSEWLKVARTLSEAEWRKPQNWRLRIGWNSQGWIWTATGMRCLLFLRCTVFSSCCVFGVCCDVFFNYWNLFWLFVEPRQTWQVPHILAYLLRTVLLFTRKPRRAILFYLASVRWAWQSRLLVLGSFHNLM